MNRRTFITAVGASLGTTALAGCTESESGTVDDDGDNGDAAVTVHDHELTTDATGWAKIEGEAENTSGEEQSYIEIRARLFDADGTRIDDWFDNITDVPDGQRFTFEIVTTTDYENVDDYELEWSLGAF